MARGRDGQSRWAQSRPLPRRQGRQPVPVDAPPPPVTGGDRSPAVPPKARLALAGGAIGFIVVLVFILQNLKSVRVSLFFVHWTLPLAFDLLLAALLGGAVVLTATSLRNYQQRRTGRRGRQ